MAGHSVCCCLVCNPKDTERPVCGSCVPHEKKPKKPKKTVAKKTGEYESYDAPEAVEPDSATPEYDAYAPPAKPKREPRIVNRR
jgi:hypothetical protein